MRLFLRIAPLALVCACNHPSAQPPPEQLATLAPPPAIVFDALITRNVTAILKTRPEAFPALQLVNQLLAGNDCITALERGITSTYQLQVPKVDGAGNTAYFVVEGDLPRAKVADCLTSAHAPVPIAVNTVGDLLSVTGPDGTAAYAGWRGPFMVIGARTLVEQALASPTAASPQWHDLLSTARDAPMWWGSTDALLSNLLQVPAASYQVVFERLEAAPNPYFAGRVYVTYATPGDAAIAARRVKQGEIHLPFDAPEVAESFRRMTVKQAGPKLEIGFDLGMFAGITADKLAGYAAQLPH